MREASGTRRNLKMQVGAMIVGMPPGDANAIKAQLVNPESELRRRAESTPGLIPEDGKRWAKNQQALLKTLLEDRFASRGFSISAFKSGLQS